MVKNRNVTLDVLNTGGLTAKRLNCKHPNVTAFECQECRLVFPSFKESIFDSATGVLSFPCLLNIKYVNEFYQQEQKNASVMQVVLAKPKIIYENYKPKNVLEMREYNLYVIDKQLRKMVKRGLLSTDVERIVGTPGQGRHLSAELLTYKALKKNRERVVLCVPID